MITVETMLPKVKMAIRVKADAFDAIQLTDLINAAQMDLGIAGVVVPDTFDALVSQAIVTYCRLHFGVAEDYDQLKKSYDEQKAQLMTATGYTEWAEEVDVHV